MTYGSSGDLQRYAEVIVKVGLNLQPGQRLLIGAPIVYIGSVPLELAPLVRAIVAEAYRVGSPLVEVIWEDPQLQAVRLEHAPAGSFEEVGDWRYRAGLEFVERGGAILSIYGEDPGLLAGHDPGNVATLKGQANKSTSPLWQLLSQGAVNWSAIVAPVSGWTETLFPDLPATEARDVFWDTIFEICRAKEADPVAAWQQHLSQLAVRAETLNRRRYQALKVTGPGTDLTVGLIEGHLWHSGGLKSQAGISFTANIPTEEVFTLPHRDRVDGVVTSTKPLVVDGVTVERFSLTFKGGRVVASEATNGASALQNLLDTDEGARSLGEIALVPHSSPISQSGKVFYNILIDENAANHLALGQGYRFNVEGGAAMSAEEFAAAGGNSSLIHVDFMIGSGQMNVDGIGEDGVTEPLMRDGEWAF
ncbi:MAG: aminopeptidase [Trueperaceae bacterium]|nr:MAG: aminopeptidase [Trueperaceae bacterium]